MVYFKHRLLVSRKDKKAIAIYLYLEVTEPSSLFDKEPERGFKVIY